MRYIGDVHGKWARYKNILKTCEESIQIGDMGVGFINLRTETKMSNPPFDAMSKGNHRFIRGNHDNPDVCANHKYYIKDGHIENDTMFIGGALSIDKQYRTENIDWWAKEELCTEKLYDSYDEYVKIKPKIMITHDCPDPIVNPLFGHFAKIGYPSRTRQALGSMWEVHKPDLWIFGHWHYSIDTTILGTRFICLNELEYMDIDNNNNILKYKG